MAIITPQGIDLQSPSPVELKRIKQTISDRNNISNATRYAGLEVYVVNEDLWYMLRSGTSDASWEEKVEMRITPNNGAYLLKNLSIGTTTAPQYKLDVAGTGRFTDLIVTNNTSTATLGVDILNAITGNINTANIGAGSVSGNLSVGDSLTVANSTTTGSVSATTGDVQTITSNIINTGSITATTVTSPSLFNKTDYVAVSAGAVDNGKPVVLGSNGKLDVSLLATALYFVDSFTPTPGAEYPSVAGESYGAIWVVSGVTGIGYTYTTGVLTGQTAINGDQMIWGSGGTPTWSLVKSGTDTSEFYRRDGSTAITADFAGGGFKFTNAAEGTAANDLATVDQLKVNSLYTPDRSTKVVEVIPGATNSVSVNGTLNIYGDIYQNGTAYVTHAQQIYTTNDYIITRDGATVGLAVGEYSGFQVTKYDGVLDGRLVFDSNGWARVGDVGNEKILAARADIMEDNGVVVWNNTNHMIVTETKNTAFNKNFGTGVTDVAPGNHDHDIRYYTQSLIDTMLSGKQDVISPNTAFNKNFGTVAGTVAEGDKLYWQSTSGGINYIGGNVGIGISTVSDRIHLYEYQADYGIRLQGSLSNWYIYNRYTNSGALEILYDSNTMMVFTTGQKVGIGINPTEKLEVAGNVKATDFILSSDRRLKENIAALDKGIEGLKPVAFNFKEGDKTTQYGFIAQDMLRTHPELVRGTGEEKEDGSIDYYSIKQQSIIALLVKEVQDLKKELKDLRNGIK